MIRMIQGLYRSQQHAKITCLYFSVAGREDSNMLKSPTCASQQQGEKAAQRHGDGGGMEGLGCNTLIPSISRRPSRASVTTVLTAAGPLTTQSRALPYAAEPGTVLWLLPTLYQGQI